VDEESKVSEDTVVVMPQGVPIGVAVALLIMVFALCGLIIVIWTARGREDRAREDAICAPNASVLKAQADSGRAQNELNTATQKRIEEIQVAVIKNCSEHGNIPILVNGNVDCKASPK
jgi:hypothetical protein